MVISFDIINQIGIMKSTPVICGLDLGSWTIKICAFSGQRLEILTNEANFRQTPAIVAYTATERLIGESALIKLKSNFNNTVRAPQRLLGLHRNQHLLQEQLKYEQIKYHSADELIFTVQGKHGAIDVSVEEVLITLFGKAKSIVESHNLSIAIAYLSVPTYFGQEERVALRKCAELALRKPVRLVDDWAALAAQYAYNRVKELKSLEQMKNIIFLDVGYSKLIISLVQFTRFQGRLLDWQHRPYTGCKNMDELTCEFYSGLFESQHHKTLLGQPKAFVKLLDAVQRQRVVLSANNDHHLSLEYILAEQDLTYNMKRDQLQTIIVPVLADIAAALAAIQSRNSSLSIHALELMGGASRIPCIQNMAAKIIGVEASRSLNQSEAIATGITIFGATERKAMKLGFTFDCISTKDIGVHWSNQKRIIFGKKTKTGGQVVINVGNEGLVSMSIFVEFGVGEQQIGRLVFKSPNKITFWMDEDRIIHAKLALHQFESYELGEKSEERWKAMARREEEMAEADSKMELIYEMKNDYESKFYSCKSKFEELSNYATPQQAHYISTHIAIAEQWIEEEHSKPVVAEHDLKRYQEKNEEIELLRKGCEELEGRKRRVDELKVQYDRLSEEICMALERNLSEKGRERVVEVLNWGQESYQRMENSGWEGGELSKDKLEEASLIVRSAT